MKQRNERYLISYSDCRTDAERQAYKDYAAQMGFPKNIRGDYACWQRGSYFASSQGEHWYCDVPGWEHSIYGQFCIIPLEDGTWLADGSCTADQIRFETREEALKAAVLGMTQRVRAAATLNALSRVDGPHANAMIYWACQIANIDPRPFLVREEGLAFDPEWIRANPIPAFCTRCRKREDIHAPTLENVRCFYCGAGRNSPMLPIDQKAYSARIGELWQHVAPPNAGNLRGTTDSGTTASTKNAEGFPPVIEERPSDGKEQWTKPESNEPSAQQTLFSG